MADEIGMHLGISDVQRDAADRAWAMFMRVVFGVSGDAAYVIRDMVLSANPDSGGLPPGQYWWPDDSGVLMPTGDARHLAADLLLRPVLSTSRVVPMNQGQRAALKKGIVVCPRGHEHGQFVEGLGREWSPKTHAHERVRGEHRIWALEWIPAIWRIDDIRLPDPSDRTPMPTLVTDSGYESGETSGPVILECSDPDTLAWFADGVDIDYL